MSEIKYIKKTFEECVDTISTNRKKIRQKEYLPQGNYPVIDQGQELIGGYSNNSDKVIEINNSCIIFGDHTKIIKVIDFDFVPGADGVKVLQPKNFIRVKLLAYFMEVLIHKIPDKGYARHYQHIKKETVVFPESLSIQDAMVNKLDEISTNLNNTRDLFNKLLLQLDSYRLVVMNEAYKGNLL